MTEKEIHAKLKRLTKPQQRLLTAMVCGASPSLNLERWRTLTVLCNQGLVTSAWEDERQLRRSYAPAPLVAQVAGHVWNLDMPTTGAL